MNINFRKYQERDIEFMVNNKQVLNFNPAGLGKTLECIETIDRLNLWDKKILIVATKTATSVWVDEFMKWKNKKSTLITGSIPKKKRNELYKTYDFKGITILNYQMLKEISSMNIYFDIVVSDEVHLGGLLNRTTDKFSFFKKLKYDRIVLMTATPIRKDASDLYALLHLVDRKKFKSYWKFVNQFCHVLKDFLGYSYILKKPKNKKLLNKVLKQYLVFNKKESVLKELPDKSRQILLYELPKATRDIYFEIFEDLMIDNGITYDIITSNLTKYLRVRQILVCPKILGFKEYGGALEIAKQIVENSFFSHDSVVIATPFLKAIPFIEEYLKAHIHHLKVFKIHGGTKRSHQSISKEFNAYDSYRKVLIYTIKSGASWTGTAANVGIMIGCEYSMTDQIQAEDRIHRISQTKPCFWYYIFAKDTIDMVLKKTLESKLTAIDHVLGGEK